MAASRAGSGQAGAEGAASGSSAGQHRAPDGGVHRAATCSLRPKERWQPRRRCAVLPRAHLAHGNGVDGLQVGGVGQQRQVDLLACRGSSGGCGGQRRLRVGSNGPFQERQLQKQGQHITELCCQAREGKGGVTGPQHRQDRAVAGKQLSKAAQQEERRCKLLRWQLIREAAQRVLVQPRARAQSTGRAPARQGAAALGRRAPEMVGRSYEVPRWYFTSPLPMYVSPCISLTGLRPANSENTCSMGLRITLASTLRRPGARGQGWGGGSAGSGGHQYTRPAPAAWHNAMPVSAQRWPRRRVPSTRPSSSSEPPGRADAHRGGACQSPRSPPPCRQSGRSAPSCPGSAPRSPPGQSCRVRQ